MTEQAISPEFIRWLFSAQIEVFKLTRAHEKILQKPVSFQSSAISILGRIAIRIAYS